MHGHLRWYNAPRDRYSRLFEQTVEADCIRITVMRNLAFAAPKLILIVTAASTWPASEV